MQRKQHTKPTGPIFLTNLKLFDLITIKSTTSRGFGVLGFGVLGFEREKKVEILT